MAIVAMDSITLTAMRRDRKKILEFLQRRGCVELRDVGAGDEVFEHTPTDTTRALLEKNTETAVAAAAILNRYSPPQGGGLAFLKGREAVSQKVSDDFYSVNDTVVRAAQQIVALDREVAEAKAEILRLQAQQEALVPWLDLPFPQTYKGTKYTRVFTGALDGANELSDVLLKLAEADPALDAVHIEIVSTTKSQTCLYAIVYKEQAERADAALRAIGLTRPASPTHHLPAKKRAMLAQQIAAAQQRIDTASEKIRELAARREDILFLQDHLQMRVEKYAAIEKLAQSRHAFVLEGYLPAAFSERLKTDLESSFTCAVETAPAGRGEEVPVLLHNNKFSEPTENIVESYSMPGPYDVDPTSVMSIFYYMMFGLMFSDAGYGLIMAGVCGFCLLKFKNMEPNWSKNIRMFFWCGVSTMFWGIVFSSYFGDIVNSVSSTFFGREVGIPPLWFTPLDDPIKMLLFCLSVGIIHLTVGYIMKGYAHIKNGSVIEAVYDAVFPGLIIYPLVLLLMGSELFIGIGGFRLYLPGWVTVLCLALAVVCAVGVVLTGGRESKSWGKRIAKGIYALYNVGSGWLSDILSYSRLLALGLATGVIASVMNQLAGMPASVPVLGILVYILIFLIGHALNFGINVLGAYVHSNRLEYVEFFGKFYDGGGRKFSPLGVHTKRYKILEEEPQNG